jgi:hypothetical protein
MLHKDYDRKGSVEKKIFGRVPQGVGANMNWLAVNRQSLSNCDCNIDKGKQAISSSYNFAIA